nr:calmodulin-like protein 6 isoform X2 [Chelonoidis abingdonii]XP_032635970.1 calmodulin-like protein 6 isoform X2 [Chelonoidis abingdonii]XP_032635971.1 calmodulin-like protein 6 isoform X2 [Chelonoidis abingdonii]
MFDEEGNGLVKTDDLEKLMSLMGINPTKRELATMAKEVDKDNKGTLNCNSFLVLMGIYHEKAKNQDEELRAAFKVFDKEHKGYIDWNTLKYVLTNAGEPLNEQEAELMMKEADKDGDGTIDYEDLWLCLLPSQAGHCGAGGGREGGPPTTQTAVQKEEGVAEGLNVQSLDSGLNIPKVWESPDAGAQFRPNSNCFYVNMFSFHPHLPQCEIPCLSQMYVANAWGALCLGEAEAKQG